MSIALSEEIICGFILGTARQGKTHTERHNPLTRKYFKASRSQPLSQSGNKVKFRQM